MAGLGCPPGQGSGAELGNTAGVWNGHVALPLGGVVFLHLCKEIVGRLHGFTNVARLLQ